LPNELLRDKLQTLQTYICGQLTDIVKLNFDRVDQDLTNTLCFTPALHLEQAKAIAFKIIKQIIHKIKHSKIQNSFQSSSNITGSTVTFINTATQLTPVYSLIGCV